VFSSQNIYWQKKTHTHNIISHCTLQIKHTFSIYAILFREILALFVIYCYILLEEFFRQRNNLVLICKRKEPPRAVALVVRSGKTFVYLLNA